jgi:hypothetical protein
MYGMIDKGFLPTCRVSLILYYRITTWLLEPLWSRKLIIIIIYIIAIVCYRLYSGGFTAIVGNCLGATVTITPSHVTCIMLRITLY